MKSNAAVSERAIARLSLYRRLLGGLVGEGVENVFSHDLAAMSGGTAAQVRRDVMALGFTGSPSRGYNVAELLEAIDAFLDAPEGTAVGLVGAGNLGRALLNFFLGRRPRLAVVAAFDNDPQRVDRVICGCRCYPMEALDEVVERERIRVGILTVPADQAQTVADRLVHAGVEGILNFAPVPLRLPTGVYAEDIDITSSLEKVAYFARQGVSRRETLS